MTNEEKLKKYESQATIYGEVCIEGMNQLLESFKDEVKDDAIFLDIGSGFGKIVTYMAEIGGYNSIGIELVEEKHEIAKKILWTNTKNKIKLIKGNIKDNLEILKQADVVFCNCVLFPFETVKWINENKKNNCIFIQNHSKIRIEGNWQTLPLKTSWKKGKESLFYKTNTITNR